MFAKLFAESGLSLDRLKSLLEVGAAGSIVKAAEGDPVRQSQFSRQIKELEDFFRIKLIERQGKGTRLTPSGKELARISRFFMLGLSNFQRGCLGEEQMFRTITPFVTPLLLGVQRPFQLSPNSFPRPSPRVAVGRPSELRHCLRTPTRTNLVYEEHLPCHPDCLFVDAGVGAK